MASTRFTIDATFKAIDKFSGPVARMTTGMDRFTRRMRKGIGGIGKMTKRVARSMRSMALTLGSLGVLGGYALKGILAPAVHFEHAVAGINAKTRGAIKAEGRLNEVRAKALKLGGSTIFTSIQVAEAMQDLAKAGLTTNEILGGIEPILHAAGAEGSGISDVSKVIISTMKAFDKTMSLENTTKTADVFANVATKAKTSILDLAEGVSKFAPVAHLFGFAMEDSIAFVAALQDVGIEASMSGTQLKTMFSKLSGLSKKARKEFNLLGIDVKDALEAGDAPEVIKRIMEGLGRATSKEQKVRAMREAFGQRGMVASMLLAASRGKKSKGLLNLLEAAGESSKGAAKEIYDIQQGTTMGAFTELKSAWETFRIAIGTQQLPRLAETADKIAAALRDPKNIQKFAGYLEKAVTGISDFWANNKKFLTDLAYVFAGLIRIAWAITKFVGIILIGIGKLLGMTFDFADTIAGKMPGGDALNAFMAGLAPDFTGEAYRTEGHVGAPWAPGEVSGVIVVKAEQGTRASVQDQPNGGVGLSVEYSGQDALPAGGA